MGRRQQAAELRSTWTVFEAREPGRPFRRKDMEDADARLEADRAAARNAIYYDGHTLDAVPAISARVYLPVLTAVATRSVIGNTAAFVSAVPGSIPGASSTSIPVDEEAPQVMPDK